MNFMPQLYHIGFHELPDSPPSAWRFDFFSSPLAAETALRQLRDGYVTRRTSPFPASIALVGMRDIRDYYVLDLGILRENENHALVPGNPMYAEIMLRYLSNDEQVYFYSKYGTPFWLKPDGSLDMPALMVEFQRFWRENSGADHEVYGYNEATPHLVLMGYLQRVRERRRAHRPRNGARLEAP